MVSDGFIQWFQIKKTKLKNHENKHKNVKKEKYNDTKNNMLNNPRYKY